MGFGFDPAVPSLGAVIRLDGDPLVLLLGVNIVLVIIHDQDLIGRIALDDVQVLVPTLHWDDLCSGQDIIRDQSRSLQFFQGQLYRFRTGPGVDDYLFKGIQAELEKILQPGSGPSVDDVGDQGAFQVECQDFDGQLNYRTEAQSRPDQAKNTAIDRQ